jgi:hypothetical protein
MSIVMDRQLSDILSMWKANLNKEVLVTMRTFIIAILVTGWMVVTGCSSLKQPAIYSTQFNACVDHGRSGYECPDTAKAMASNASDNKISN